METTTAKPATRTLKIVAILLGVYYLGYRFFNFFRMQDHFMPSNFGFSSILFLLHLFYLPISIYLVFANKKISWYLIGGYLAYAVMGNLIELVVEMAAPREIYNHPDSWGHTTRLEIYLTILVPLLFWAGLLGATLQPKTLTAYEVQPLAKNKTLLIAAAASVACWLLAKLFMQG